MEDFISLGFGETLQEVFERCHEQGLELPWIVCLVSPNGCTTVMRIHSKEMPGDVLAEHLEPEGFQLPMTIDALDAPDPLLALLRRYQAERKAFDDAIAPDGITDEDWDRIAQDSHFRCCAS